MAPSQGFFRAFRVFSRSSCSSVSYASGLKPIREFVANIRGWFSSRSILLAILLTSP